MNPQPEIGTIEHCKLVLAEWKAKAEASEKERAELKSEVSQLCITGRALLAKAETAEARLKEATWLLNNSERSRRNGWNERRDAFLASQKEEK